MHVLKIVDQIRSRMFPMNLLSYFFMHSDRDTKPLKA